MTTSARCAALVAAALALTPAAATADTHHWKKIDTPSKLVYCESLKYGAPAFECTADYIPRTFPEGDPIITLRPHGKSHISTRSDEGGYNVTLHTLQYGDVNAVAGVRCHLKTTGLTCRNKGGHGFHLAKGDVRQF
jgi:hypothetical protein